MNANIYYRGHTNGSLSSTTKTEASSTFSSLHTGVDTYKQGSSSLSNSQQEVLNNLSNQNRCLDENTLAGVQNLSMTELQKELIDTKDKLKIVT